MIESVDNTVDPCDDFFEYACGGYVKKHVIPEDEYAKGTFDDLIDEVDIKLKGSLHVQSNLY